MSINRYFDDKKNLLSLKITYLPSYMKSQIYKISKKGAWGNGTVCTVSAAETWQCEDLHSDSQHHGTYICNPQTGVWGAFRQTDA